MHYWIDGYNMLFRLLHESDNLQSQREIIIHDLNKKVTLVKLNISIVFDGTFHIGEHSRSHYDQLEIHYTGEGETADEYILDEVKNALHPQQETIVTSDKKLAWLVRNRLAHTQSVEDFISWLNRSYKNKLRQLKQDRVPSVIPPVSVVPTQRSRLIDKEIPLETSFDYYAQIFEAEWQEILKEEQVQKQAASAPLSKRPPRKPRRSRDPFAPPLEPEVQEASEMERWLKVFEKRLSESD